MKFWQSVSFERPEDLIEIAKVAEEVGFEGLLLSDHLFVPEKYEPGYLYSESGRPDFTAETPFPDAFCTISALAQVTSRLRFATLVYILPLKNPLEIAKQLATTALLSQDRVVLGAGAGWMKEEFDVLGVDFASRGKRFNECIEVMRLVWKGEMVEYHGDHFDLPRLQMSPAPRKPIPIFIGGASKAALRRAAILGDGWAGAGNSVEEVKGILTELNRLREEAGRADRPFETIVPLTEQATPEQIGELMGLGMHGTVNYPFMYTAPPGASLEQKIAVLRGFGEAVIQPTLGG